MLYFNMFVLCLEENALGQGDGVYHKTDREGFKEVWDFYI